MRRLNDWQVHFRLQFDLTVAADASLAAAASSSSSSLLGPAGGATSSSPSSGQFWSAHLWPQGVTYDALPVTARVRVYRSCALDCGDSFTFAKRPTLLQLLIFCLNLVACLCTHAFLQVLLLYGLVCYRLDHADSAEWLHRARDQFQSESAAAAGTSTALVRDEPAIATN
jgi:hypothetical protein